MQSGVMREFDWPEQRVWVNHSYFGVKEYLEKLDLLEFTKIFETLTGYHGTEILAKLANAHKISSKYSQLDTKLY